MAVVARFSVDNLLLLPWAAIGHLWPAQRVVLGRRVCKALHRELAAHAREIALVKREEVVPDERSISEDLRRLAGSTGVTMHWNDDSHGCSVLLRAALSSKIAFSGLHLQEVELSDMTVLSEVLQACTALQSLDLSENEISNADTLFPHGLASCTTLVHVNLASTFLDSSGAQRLAEALSECTRLAHIDLRLNSIGSHGAEKLAAVLGSGFTLRYLDVSENNIQADGMQKLVGALEGCPDLTHLKLGGNELGDCGLGPALKRCTSLQCLDLTDCFVGPQSLSSLTVSLAQCTDLTQLALCRSDLRCSGAEMIGTTLGMWPFLKYLDLRGNVICEAGVCSLAQGLRKSRALTHLDLNYNAIGSSRGAEALGAALGKAKTLRFLGLGRNRLGDSGLGEIVRGIRTTPDISQLDLRSNQLTDVSAILLAGTVHCWTSLSRLMLRGNDFSPAQKQSIVSALSAGDDVLQI